MNEQVQKPLTLVMKVKSAEDSKAVQTKLNRIQSLPTEQNPSLQALKSIGTVHFARFVFLEDFTRLAVITSYDGTFEKYAMDFVDKIGFLFNEFLQHMEDALSAAG